MDFSDSILQYKTPESFRAFLLDKHFREYILSLLPSIPYISESRDRYYKLPLPAAPLVQAVMVDVEVMADSVKVSVIRCFCPATVVPLLVMVIGVVMVPPLVVTTCIWYFPDTPEL